MTIDNFLFKKHLEKGEKILYAVHKHWVEISIPFIELVFFAVLIPLILYLTLFTTKLFLIIVLFFNFFALIRLIYIFIDWYSDVWLITNMSVIVVEWNGIFSNNSARIGYEDIEGASYQIKGFFGTIMRFANTTLRVMSGSHFDLKNAKNAKKAELAINKFKESYLNNKNIRDASNLKALLSNLVSNTNK